MTTSDAAARAALAAHAEPLPPIDDPDFAKAFDRFADRRVALLGEASHGTSEFYRARAAITKRFVETHGFDVVAIEADWPDAAVVDGMIRGRDGDGGETPFARFPRWMWRNGEFADLLLWLRAHNARAARPVGFYGLDIYNMNASIAAVLRYLDAVDPEAAAEARVRYGCLTPWRDEPARYGRAVVGSGYRTCEAAVLEQCQAILQRSLARAAENGDALLDAAQNARLVAAAERYYRVMHYGGPDAWNLRDTHMAETLRHVLDARGPQSRALVWAHNSHVGDARGTEMGARGEINLGQLCREAFGDQVAIIGFGTHAGEVAAADDWDEPMQVMRVRPSLPGSHEALCHEAGLTRALLDLSRAPLRDAMDAAREERFIGVIYRPQTERASHYMSARLARQFDAYVWFDETTAVSASPEPGEPHAEDTFPFGL